MNSAPSQEWLDAQFEPGHRLYGLSWDEAQRIGGGTEVRPDARASEKPVPASDESRKA